MEPSLRGRRSSLGDLKPSGQLNGSTAIEAIGTCPDCFRPGKSNSEFSNDLTFYHASGALSVPLFSAVSGGERASCRNVASHLARANASSQLHLAMTSDDPAWCGKLGTAPGHLPRPRSDDLHQGQLRSTCLPPIWVCNFSTAREDTLKDPERREIDQTPLFGGPPIKNTPISIDPKPFWFSSFFRFDSPDSRWSVCPSSSSVGFLSTGR